MHSNTIPQENISLSIIRSVWFELKPSERKIFVYLQWFCNTYEKVCPSTSFIGKKTGFCRDTVSKAIRELNALGMLNIHRRHRRTSCYSMSNEVLDLDTNNLGCPPKKISRNEADNAGKEGAPETTKCKRVKLSAKITKVLASTKNPTPFTNSYKKEIKNVRGDDQHTQCTTKKLPPCLENTDLGTKDKKDIWKVARFSERILYMAFEAACEYAKKCTIRNLAAFLIWKCVDIRNCLSRIGAYVLPARTKEGCQGDSVASAALHVPDGKHSPTRKI